MIAFQRLNHTTRKPSPRRVALGRADEWLKLQACLTEQFDRFQQQREQLRKDYAAFKGETGVTVDFDEANQPAR